MVTVNEELVKGLEDLEIRGQVETTPNYCIVEIGQNTEKSPGDLRILAVTQIPMKKHQLMLVGKTFKRVKQQQQQQQQQQQ